MNIVKIAAAAALALAGLAGTSAATAAPLATVSARALAVTGQSYRVDRGDRWNDNRRYQRREVRSSRYRHYSRARYYNRGRICHTEYRRYQGRVTVCRRR